MRQYRGLTKDGKWVYGEYISSGKALSYIVPNDAVFTLGRTGLLLQNIYPVIPESIGQSTGLKDKNDKEIYFDSDIVNYTYISDRGGEEEEEFTVTGIVVLDLKHTNSICVLEKRNGRTGGLYHFTAGEVRNIEIIGNIHQNSKLLEKP